MISTGFRKAATLAQLVPESKSHLMFNLLISQLFSDDDSLDAVHVTA
jgi:hypothetical protein